MRSDAGRSAVRTSVLTLLVLASACVPMDDAMQKIFGRSMRDQPSFDPYESPLAPAPGAVSFSSGNYAAGSGQVNLGDPRIASVDVPPFTAADMATGGGVAAALVNPVAPTPESLARGKVVYDRMCAICHGPIGVPTDAPILPKFPAMVAFPLANGGALLRTDGYIFGMITAGRGIMPPYGHQVTYHDRWNIVNYVRQLQGRIPAPGGTPAVEPAVAPPPGGEGQ